MKTVYLEKLNGQWLASPHETPFSIEVEDNIKAPAGSIWNGDYKSGRPKFKKPAK